MRLSTRVSSTAAARLLSVLVLVSAAGSARAQEDYHDQEQFDLTDLSLEELLDMEVTVASRTEQKLSEVPGAVYVITGDEIRRSGHASVQEALRMVPGFYVSNWTTSQWDVTSRGFGSGLSLSSLAYLNQLLVLIDGVVVYTPLFAGTWWALQDVDVDDVDRIEIIRGPGGILWGSNAVHGVVHVITKSSADTQGFRISSRAGNDQRHVAGRFGGRFGDGEGGSFRYYLKHSDYDSHDNPYLGFDQAWDISSTGFRLDFGEEGERRTTVHGRGYTAELGADGFDLVDFVPIPVVDDKSGFQVFASTTSEAGDETWTTWVSLDEQDIETELELQILTADLEYKRDFELGESSKLTAGIGYRLVDSDLEGDDPFYLHFDPEQQTQNNIRAFGVHTWMLDDWDLIVGAQLESNEFTGLEFQPTLRASWHPEGDYSAWGALTRSVRTPSLEEVSLDQDSVFVGDPDFKSESVLSYELGVRRLFGEVASVDVAAFFNQYDDLHTREFDPNTFQEFLGNDGEGESYGVEISADVKPNERWSLRSAYTLFRGKYTNELDGSDLGTEEYHPQQQLNLRSYYDLCEDWELDAGFYLVDDLGPAFEVAEYVRLDARIGWNPSEELEFYVGALQFNEDSHSEFDAFDNIHRQVYFGLSWMPGAGG